MEHVPWQGGWLNTTFAVPDIVLKWFCNIITRLKLHIDCKILKFHKHILSMPQDSIIYQALLMDKTLLRSNVILQHLPPYIEYLNLESGTCSGK